MKCYDVLFNRFYKLFSKGASANPSYEKFDGAILSSFIFSSILFINFLTLLQTLNIILKCDIKIKMFYALAILILLMIINLFYFLRQNKYLEISSFMNSLTRRKQNNYSIITIIYSLLSIGLFFLLLNAGK